LRKEWRIATGKHLWRRVISQNNWGHAGDLEKSSLNGEKERDFERGKEMTIKRR